jgi:hypothetical protein
MEQCLLLYFPMFEVFAAFSISAAVGMRVALPLLLMVIFAVVGDS